jgi:hypothetical protein
MNKNILVEDKWLTKIIEIPCYIALAQTIEEYLRIKPKSLMSPYFITIKTRSISSGNFDLQNSQIKYITTMHNYIWWPKSTNIFPKDTNISNYDFKDKKDIIELGKNLFVNDRFNVDTRLGKNLAIKIKQTWLEANLAQDRNTKNLIFKLPNKQIIGFNSLIISNESIIIDLIAVKKEFRNCGIGTALIKASQQFALELSLPIRVGTQINNSANALYLSNGFKKNESLNIFHDLLWD